MRNQSCFATAIVFGVVILSAEAADAQFRGLGFGAGRPMMSRPFAGSQVVPGHGKLKATGAHGRPAGERFDGRYYIKGVQHRYSKKGGRSIDGLKAEQDVIEQSGGDADLRVRVGSPPSITRSRPPRLR